MSDRRPRRPGRRPIILTADLAPRPAAKGQRRPPPPVWRSLGPLLLRQPLMVPLLLIGMVLEAVQTAFFYVTTHFIRWDYVRRRHDFNWRHPAAIVVIPLALLAWVVAFILVAPVTYALIARDRYIRWQETLCGRK